MHVDINYLPQMPDADQRTYLFATIDRATRWVCPWKSRNLRRRLSQAPDRQGSLHPLPAREARSARRVVRGRRRRERLAEVAKGP
ncbi:MAG: hypothetical protein [Olavius algarvensis Gamma 1 endosymbiont]|nr:MAG: hypothetical protein [Olavius algarvensis Gamma 1 endosymbiont]